MRILRRIFSLISDRSGAALPLVGICMVGIIGLIGLAIDSGRSYAVKSKLSTALDAASLAGAKMLTSSNAASPALEAEIQNLFNANIATGYLNATITVPKLADQSICVGTFDTNNVCVADPTFARMSVKSTAVVPTMIMQIFNVATPTAIFTASANRQNSVEVVMVLDNSGSMNNTLSGSSTSKISNLKTAAGNLVTTLTNSFAGTSGTASFGVVPFTGVVRLNTSAIGLPSWLDLSAQSPSHSLIFASSANRFTLFRNLGLTWAGCVEWRANSHDLTDNTADIPTSADPSTLFVPYFWPDEPDQAALKTAASYGYNFKTYNDYVGDGYSSTDLSKNYLTREKNQAKYVPPLNSGTNSMFGDPVGPNSGCLIEPLQRLTTNTTAIGNEINGMVAAGDTDLPLGLAWGWHVLSPNLPFADGALYTTNTTSKYVVMLTDGFSHDVCAGDTTNQNAGYPNGTIYSSIGYVWEGLIVNGGVPVTNCSSSDNMQGALDTTLGTLCTNMKAAGITIFTVGLLATTDPEPVALEACATGGKNGGKYILENDPTQLANDFANIAGQIAKLRLSR